MTDQKQSSAREQQGPTTAPENVSSRERADDQHEAANTLRDPFGELKSKWRGRRGDWYVLPMEVVALIVGILTFAAVVVATWAAVANIDPLRDTLNETRNATRAVEAQTY